MAATSTCETCEACGQRIVRKRDWVPNEQLREAVLAKGVSYCQIATRMGILRTDSRRPHLGRRFGDGTAIRRALGVTGFNSQGRRRDPQKFIDYNYALRIARAANLDPYEAGL